MLRIRVQSPELIVRCPPIRLVDVVATRAAIGAVRREWRNGDGHLAMEGVLKVAAGAAMRPARPSPHRHVVLHHAACPDPKEIVRYPGGYDGW